MNINPGQAPGNFQVDLNKLSNNLGNTLAPGMLGNKTINPMASIQALGGQSRLGLQNAIANSRMQDLNLQGKEQALQQAMKQYEQQQQQPGITDILGLLGSGIGAIKGIDARDALNQLSPQDITDMQNMMLNNPLTQMMEY